MKMCGYVKISNRRIALRKKYNPKLQSYFNYLNLFKKVQNIIHFTIETTRQKTNTNTFTHLIQFMCQITISS